MSKTIKLQGGKIVEKLTKFMDRHGRLKGRNKKETKMLKDACEHHSINKKGRVKPEIYNDQGVCHCDMCHHSFSASVYEKKDVEERVDNIVEVVDQAKYLAVALDAGEEVENNLVNLSILLGQFGGIYKKLKNVAEKKENLSKKNKNKGNKNGGGSASFGGWHTR